MMKFIIRKILNKDKDKDNYALLKKSEVDWDAYALTLPDKVKDPVLFFMHNYLDYPLKIVGVFHSSYYLKNNPDVLSNGTNPLVHFLIYGQYEGRSAWQEDDEIILKKTENKKIVDNNDFKSRLEALLLKEKILQNGLSSAEQEKWINELIDVSESGIVKIQDFFDQEHYEAMYPDVADPSINSFFHYIFHGHEEGRLGFLDIDSLIIKGGQEKDKHLSSVLLVSHEASATGAPVVALEVSKRLSKYFNIVTCTLRGGELHSDFVEAGIVHLDAPGHLGVQALEFCIKKIIDYTGVNAVLLNSVESVEMAEAAFNLGLPTASLLHEFAEYTRPIGKVSRMLLASDMVMYPAKSLMSSGLNELSSSSGIRTIPNHIVIQPQGYLDFKIRYDSTWSLRQQLGLSNEDLLIVGAGHVQPRKGVDWFLETCHYIFEIMSQSNDVRANKLQFVWLGNGYNENDTLVSVWLDAYMHRVGIKDRVHFPGAVHDVGLALREADLFLLTSKLDPFPNVAIDALHSDCGIGVFAESSGIADFVVEKYARAAIGKYGDARNLAENIVEKFDYLISKNGVNSAICSKELSFDNYVINIKVLIDESIARRDELKKLEELDCFRKNFSANFYNKDIVSEFAVKNHFLSQLIKGIAVTKPFPGSDIQAVCDNINVCDFQSAVEMAMSAKVEGMPVTIIKGAPVEKIYSGRIALQFHIYFEDLIPEFCEYFKTLTDHNVDLFVSHVPELNDAHIKQLEESVSGSLHLQRFDNQGRDVYPFYRQFIDNIEPYYDIVGHFHTKKSNDVANGVGDRWRRYLLGNLMGSRAASIEILSLFNDFETGLVFAEDRHLVDEGKNSAYIELLLKQMGLCRRDNYHHFPLGTMFWARVSALSSLAKIKDDTFNLPEPIPYDGSVLHAFERILPQLVEESNYSVKRIYTENTIW